MKRFLSVICMALLAGGMIFTSCTKNWTVTVKSNNDAWGTVTGGGTFADGATTTIQATPAQGYQFVKWDDGVKDNPRTLIVSANVNLTAEFAAIPVEPGVKVTFNNAVWDAKQVAGAYYEDRGAWDVFAAKVSSSELPLVECAAFADAVGTYSDATTDGQTFQNQVIAFCEYYDAHILQDEEETTYGDWWAKSANIEVSSFDILNMTITANVGATMFDAYTAFVEGQGFAAAPTAPMTMKVTEVNMQSAKGNLKKVSTKLAVK